MKQGGGHMQQPFLDLRRCLYRGSLGRIWALMGGSGLDLERPWEAPGRVLDPPGTYFSRFLHAYALAVVEFFRRAFWKASGVDLGATRATDLECGRACVRGVFVLFRLAEY